MPVYVYKCPICSSEKTVEQSISKMEAPKCNHGMKDAEEIKMEIVIQPTTFILRGAGWAKDGYRSK